MPTGYDTRPEDRQALIDLVSEEIKAHEQGQIDSLSTNSDLSQLMGTSIITVSRILKGLSESEKSYRINSIKSKKGEKNPNYENDKLAKLSRKERNQLIDSVKEELSRFREGSIDVLRTNSDLSATYNGRGITPGNIASYLSESSLSQEDKDFRALKIRRERVSGEKNPGTKHEWTVDARKKVSDRFRGVQKSKQHKEKMRDRMLSGEATRLGKMASQTLRKTRYNYKGNWFDSQSEATSGVLMQKYIPNYRLEEGKTFQINQDIPITIDFLIGNTFVEYHPSLLFNGKGNLGDIPTCQEYASYRHVRSSLPPEERKEFDREYNQILAVAYRSSREAAIAQSPTYQGKELLLIQTPGELYDSVITRFGSNFPSRSEFVREFNQVKKQVKEANKK